MESQAVDALPLGFATPIDEAQHLRDHGRYKEAAELLRCSVGSPTVDAAEIALELGQTLQSQGYWAEALKTWEECLETSSGGHGPNLIHLRVRMNICLLRPMIRENLQGLSESFADARLAHGELKRLSLDDDKFAHGIYFRDTYCKVLLFTSQFHLPQIDHEAFAWVDDMFEACMSKKEYRLALIVARQYIVAASTRFGRHSSGFTLAGWFKMTQQLINAASMPSVFKAAALDLIAEYAEQLDALVQQREVYERDAMQLYDQAGHVNGAANIHIRQLSRKCASGEGNVEEHVGNVAKYLSTFEDQGYIWGLLRGLQALQSSLTDTRYFDFQLSLIQMNNEAVEVSQARLFSLLIQFKSIAAWLAHSGRAARVIEASIPLYEKISKDEAQTLKGLFSHVISQAFFQLGDLDTAMTWTNRSLALLPPQSTDRANATTLELRIILLNASSHGGLDVDKLLERWGGVIEQDTQDGAVEAAIEKLDALIGLLTRAKDTRAVSYLEKVEKLIPLLGTSKMADAKLAAFYQESAASAMSQIVSRHPDTELEESAIALLEKAVPLHMKHGALIEACNSRQMQALAHFSIFRKSRDHVRLDKALELTCIALDCFRVLDVTNMVSLAAYWCGFYTYIAWEYGLATAENLLQQLAVAEKAKNEERVDIVIFGGVDALNRKRQLRGEAKTQEVYDMAQRVCIRRGLTEELWQWTQKSKARSLSDLLGLGVLVPDHLMSDIEQNPASRALFEEEKGLQERISVAESSERIQLRNQLHLLHRRMEDHASLRDLMDLRAGNPVTKQQLDGLVVQAQKEVPQTNVVFVDWVCVDGELFLVSVRNHDQPRVFPCVMTDKQLKSWNEKYIVGEQGSTMGGIYTSELEEDDPEYCLRQLDALIAPIAEFSEECDLLVLCATGLLHSIPLHALWIDNEPLILRNPVVYCASLTSAWQCWRGAFASPSTSPRKKAKTIVAVYNDEADTRFSPVEQARIYASADSLSVQIQAEAMVGENATMANFRESIRQSSLFHFHGHCILNPEDLVKQSMLLADGSLSVLDVFKLQFDTSPHITLIACDSAMQSISPNGDEPLGLVTGLLCAGASSVLGTMWPISSATGRQFSEHFYNELDEALVGEDTPNEANLVDLASALQAAVMEIRGEARTRRPFHWASFVLHGSPFMRL
ncbi:CHAT domain-containing protein [Stachybotrys elegans]|uniref:CHAT domain-containing protein n=1 Tax=Stachybotrys elegans TaxID=80388 RepID=A0A8K0SFN4_9HYPO|nr:CHAT domain-containing protein [Stachybotrys elegans]